MVSVSSSASVSVPAVTVTHWGVSQLEGVKVSDSEVGLTVKLVPGLTDRVMMTSAEGWEPSSRV